MYTSTGDPLAGGLLLMVDAVTMSDFSSVEHEVQYDGRCVGVFNCVGVSERWRLVLRTGTRSGGRLQPSDKWCVILLSFSHVNLAAFLYCLAI